MSKSKSKLFAPKWLLLLKRIKYNLFERRPVPLFQRRTCKNCSFIYNLELYRVCPACDHGDGVVWVVLIGSQIDSIFDTKEKADYRVIDIKHEIDARVHVEDHKVY